MGKDSRVIGIAQDRESLPVPGNRYLVPVSIVPQQNHLLAGSIYENIRIVKPGATRGDVRAALAKLDCLETIESIQEGLDAEVGERGSALSPGQRQLVRFARAMIPDPRILILDEATSAIDPLTEARARRAMRLLMAGRTSFVLALHPHRREIEVRFRDIETTLGTEMLRTKSPGMVVREILMHMIVCNLVRLLMLKAGIQQMWRRIAERFVVEGPAALPKWATISWCGPVAARTVRISDQRSQVSRHCGCGGLAAQEHAP